VIKDEIARRNSRLVISRKIYEVAIKIDEYIYKR
jgi:hypothetical protein